MIKITIYPADYEQIIREYNDSVKALEEQRKVFYETNPDFPFKTMYMNVIAPPQKFVLIEEV